MNSGNQFSQDDFLRTDRGEHIWCPQCGIRPSIHCFARALAQSGIDPDSIVVVSGIGCAGRISGYMYCDSFHTTHGRAIPFATGVKLANPKLTVVVFSGDGDLFAIGGNHFIHATRRNIDISVFCINNGVYGMTGGQSAPTTHLGAWTATSPYGSFEPPFNLPHLAESCGAVYVARWTPAYMDELTQSMCEAIQTRGLSFVEIVTPCPTNYLRHNPTVNAGNKAHARVDHKTDIHSLEFTPEAEVVVGTFVRRERPTFDDQQHNRSGI